MRRQIRGLDRASTNAQDGVSAVQTAEGALNEVHDMLQRMNELANQAANGTNSMTDRQAIQDEISQLNTEIDRVSETTKFNELYLMKGAPGTKEIKMNGHDAGLKGTLSDTGDTATFTAELTTDMDVQISGKNYHIYEANDTLESFQSKVDAASTVTINGTTYNRQSTTSSTASVEAAGAASVAAKRASAAAKLSSAAGKTTSAAGKDTSAATKTSSATAKESSAATKQASAAGKQTSAAIKEASAAAKETSAALKTASAAGKTTSAANKLASSQLKGASAEIKGASSSNKQASADVKTSSASSKTLGASALRIAAADLTGSDQADKLASAALMEASAATLAASAATLSGSAAALLASAATLRGSANALKASSRTLDGSAATLNASSSTLNASAEGLRASSNALNASASSLSASATSLTASASMLKASADTLTASADDLRGSASALTESASTLAASADTMAIGSEGSLSESDIKFITPDREYLAAELKAMIVDGAQVGINGAQARTAVDTVNNKDNITMEQARDKIVYALTQANYVGVDDTTAVSVTDDGEGQVENHYEFTINKGSVTVAKDLNFDLHVGADADMTNKIGVNIANMNSKYLGVQNLQVADDSGMMATYAIDAVEDAIQKVNEQRSALGAVQNRLEHTINNLDNVVENTTAAESRIRDTDIADEMVTYSKNNILAQAGQSMLAQANQSTQGALSLLG